MDFFAAVDNITGAKNIPDREDVEGMAWGIKRFLSMHPELLPVVAFLDQYYFTLGAERFYELMVYCMPGGRYRMRSVKKDEIPEPDMSDDLRRRVCRFFKIKPCEIPILLQLVDLEQMKASFGEQPKKRQGSSKKARKRKTRSKK